MNELLSIQLLPVVLTLAAYQIGLICQKKWKSPICNPILIGVILVLLFQKVTGMTSAEYQQGAANISWLMTPATVCLAVPMYEQFQILRKNFPMILAGVVAGAVSCLAVVAGLALLFRFDTTLTMTLLPKSITSAIGAPLSEIIGGIPSVTTAAIILTGILAAIFGTTMCKIFRIEDPVAQGVAFGTAGHVIAASKANELSDLIGATASLSLVVAGLLTSLILPTLVSLLG
jgi:putative effector of murein hydrolase